MRQRDTGALIEDTVPTAQAQWQASDGLENLRGGGKKKPTRPLVHLACSLRKCLCVFICGSLYVYKHVVRLYKCASF